MTAEEIFEIARKEYIGTKRGHDTEWKYFKKHKDCVSQAEKLLYSVREHKRWWILNHTEKRYIPHFRKFIYNRQWEEELPWGEFKKQDKPRRSEPQKLVDIVVASLEEKKKIAKEKGLTK